MFLIDNPIFKREFVSSARSLKTNFLVWAYLLTLAGLLLILWPGSGIHSAVSESSKQIFSLFFSVNLTLIILLVPAFAATSITYERENDTYPALFSTLLSPFDIMLGKLASSILMLLILVVLSMPIASVCALTGGVSLLFIFKAMLLLIVTALSYGLIGLACSALCERSSSAILLNYVLIILFAGATWLPDALLSAFGYAEVWQVVRNISPFDALFFLLYPDNYKLTMTLADIPASYITPYNIFIVSSLLLSLLGLAVFIMFIFRGGGRSSAQKGEVYSDARKALKRKLSWPFYLFDPLKRKKPIRRFYNPVFVTEMRSKLFANPRFVIRSVSAIFIISMGLLTLIAFQFGVGLQADTIRTVAIIFQIGVVAMLAPGVSSGLITDEITGGTMMSLRMTLLKPFTVIMGKLQATFFYALIFILSSLFIIFAMAYLEQQELFPEGALSDAAWWTEVFKRAGELGWWGKFWDTYRRIFAWVGILLLSTVTFLTAGLFSSAVSRTTGIATAVGYTITAFICLVSFAPVVLAGRLSASLSSFIISFNPIAAAMQITNDAFDEYPDLWTNNLIALCFLIAFFLTGATLRTWYLFNKQD